MLETSARLLRLLSLLQTPRDWTGTELAERLGVSARTAVRTPGGGRFTPRPLPSDDLAGWVSQRVAFAGWRYRARVRVSAPAAMVLERIGPYVGTVTAVDDESSVLDTGSDSLETLAVYLGLLGYEFRVESPAELAVHVRELAERYQRATR